MVEIGTRGNVSQIQGKKKKSGGADTERKRVETREGREKG